MSDICPGDCTYATVTGEAICTMGELGRVPIIVVETPDWIVNGPYDDATEQVLERPDTADAMEEEEEEAPIVGFNSHAHIIDTINADVYRMLVEERAPVADVVAEVVRQLTAARENGFDLSLEDTARVVKYVNDLVAAAGGPKRRSSS
jgi:hypothetical protein